MDFARNLRTMRAIRRLTQAKLARAASTTVRIIIAIEADKVLPTPDLEHQIRKALNWTKLEDKAFELLAREVVPVKE